LESLPALLYFVSDCIDDCQIIFSWVGHCTHNGINIQGTLDFGLRKIHKQQYKVIFKKRVLSKYLEYGAFVVYVWVPFLKCAHVLRFIQIMTIYPIEISCFLTLNEHTSCPV
jgi:hypothetical protein